MLSEDPILHLVQKTVSGDREALEQLISLQKGSITLKIRRLTNCPEDVEDIGQEVAIRIFQCIGSLKSPEAYYSWLHTLVNRECFRHFAAQTQTEPFDDDQDSEILIAETDVDCLPLACAERHDQRVEIQAALSRMPEIIQRMVALHYGNEMCHREIAEYLNIPVGTVSSNLFRAIQKLRKELYS